MIWFGNRTLNGTNGLNILEWLRGMVWWSWLCLIKLPCGVQWNPPSKHVNEQLMGYVGLRQVNLVNGYMGILFLKKKVS